MKKQIIKLYYFFKSEKVAKYPFEISIYVAITIAISFIMPGDLFSTTISTMIGFVLSSFLLRIIKLLFGFLEDKIKVSGDTKELLSIYHSDKSYKKTVILNGTQRDFIYHEVYMNKGEYELDVIDDENKHFELDDLIVNCFLDLYAIHGRSTKNNEDTIRLDSVRLCNGKMTFFTSRSNFFNHLVTNRAIDYKLMDNLRLRDVYEYGPYLKPLENSKFSNHIGINALVFLKGNILLIPKRKGDSTISKLCVTSSIATRLQFPKNGGKIDRDFMFHQNIIDSLETRLKIDLNKLDESRVSVDFLGVGQNIYEGGKPQAYFAVQLDYDMSEYPLLLEDYETIKMKSQKEGTIDRDGRIYLACLDSMKFISDEWIEFEYVNEVIYKQEKKILYPKMKNTGKKMKKRKIQTGYEKSYMINFWHYFNK